MKCDSDGSRFARSLYIALSFSLAGAEDAFMFMALIGSTGRDKIDPFPDHPYKVVDDEDMAIFFI